MAAVPTKGWRPSGDAVVVRSRGPTIHGDGVGPWEMERVGRTTFIQRDTADLATEQLAVVLMVQLYGR